MNQGAPKGQDLRVNEDGRQKVPRWLPITLLTVTTVALTIPGVLLWRQRQALGQQTRFSLRSTTSASHPPPARRRPTVASVSAVSGPGQSRTNARPLASSGSDSPRSVPPPRRSIPRTNDLRANSVSNVKSAESTSEEIRGAKLSEILFDGPLMSLGALGIATAAVGVGAVLGVWGVQKALGVKNVHASSILYNPFHLIKFLQMDEFAARMRELLLTHMPIISQRIYRSSLDEDLISRNGTQIDTHRDEEGNNWTWEEAEDRLRDAFDHGGVGDWAECAIRELEAEEEVERRRRGL
ncbi:hypothetical protein A7U60_g3704 [Sanghuangporus baumii]|uniref:Uncharacterized protein n=1 Tax=Sanghuangporus baumii TaxID=108892 RepID=A0A9Q5I094_SANBA|nr:hypothetical protein A7U60_g3704 [Sanghuangporus baumii]